MTSSRTDGSGRARPMMAPRSDRVLIPRPALAEEVVEAFTRGDPAVSLTAGLQGTGGFGKTTLAEMLCADPRIDECFPDGILWTILGEGGSEEHLPARIAELFKVVTKESLVVVEPEAAGRALAEALGESRYLIVVDDVWTPGQLAPFRMVAPSCGRLITTRNTGVLGERTHLVRVEAMEDHEAKALLLAGLPDAPAGLTDRLLKGTGRMPLLLALVHGFVSMLVHRQCNRVEDALKVAVDRLESAGPTGFGPAPGGQGKNIQQTLSTSLQFLKETGRPGDYERYLRLAVFDETESIPLSALERWWGQPREPLAAAEVHRLCQDLESIALILRYQLNPARIQLHEVVVRYLRWQLGPARETALRDEWLELLPDRTFDDDD